MMHQYSREDGIQCLAMQFEESADVDPKHVFELLSILNNADLNAIHVKVKMTDEWFENEDGEPEQRIIGEHIKTNANQDQLFIGDYIIVRDGDTYIMDGKLFEAMWSKSITEDMDDWEWILNKRLPYSTRTGYWQHKRDEDIVSLDGGASYFRLSERPNYRLYGQLYRSVVKIGA